MSTSKGQLRWPYFGTPSIPEVQGPLKKRLKINPDIPVGILNLRPRMLAQARFKEATVAAGTWNGPHPPLPPADRRGTE